EQRLAAPRNEGDDIREYLQAQERQRAEQAFIEHASAAETYPLLSRLPPESRVQLAHEHASRFREAGVDFDLAMLARHAEGKLRHQFELLGGTLSTGQPAQRESSAGAVRATGPTAITNAAAAETSGALRDLSVEERRELAAEQLRRLTMAQQQ